MSRISSVVNRYVRTICAALFVASSSYLYIFKAKYLLSNSDITSTYLTLGIGLGGVAAWLVSYAIILDNRDRRTEL